ncbi:MAG: VWA domain-containing protein [candidate division NC10 bacterium]|nr:VWA domain-containing protein [candidate division NC10 bacterium]
MMESTHQRDLLTTTVRFCRALRERGLLVTPAEAIDAVKTLNLVDLGDRQEVYWGLRSVLTSRVEDLPIFEELFETFWGFNGSSPQSLKGLLGGMPPPTTEVQEPPPTPKRPTKGMALSLERWLNPDEGQGEPIGLPGMSDQEALIDKDFSIFGAEELEEITKVATRIARRLAARPSRRRKPTRKGQWVDLRRTFRRSLKTGGDPIELTFQERKTRKTKLVTLCDVSGSMDLYSRFLLQFLYALQNSFARVETFTFSTSLSRITDHLKGHPYLSALGRLSGDVRDWSGGTRIGPSLTTFNKEWPSLVDKRTIVIILSDGWDTGEPEELAEALVTLKKRSGRLIWLNPLLGSPTYQPLTRGMQAALPYVDVFASAHNLASLKTLERHLYL